MYENIMLASDGSADSIKAADQALQLANLTNAKVDIVYVVDGETSKHDVLRNVDPIGMDEERRDKLRAAEQKAVEANVSYDVTILRGNPSTTIVEYAAEKKVDLIVMGTRGLNVLQEMVVGSVSHQVIQKANSPVLIVK
ncbi:universal stress protein [Alkalihalobacillus macyae]|uniref:universal stress protein n=1 Tax=Guptibacillus hwajinpoensis TaxID=208199 RepID=UPI00273B12FB|nr:universal stress protein [Alkalihalobacillus macyae]MDP4549389.1 universal stress protein [Alkalihalobacillus macyae]